MGNIGQNNIGKEMLLHKFGSVQGVAKAYLSGEVEACLQPHVRDVCDIFDIATAEAICRLDICRERMRRELQQNLS